MRLIVVVIALLLVRVSADYEVGVRVYRYWNPEHRRFDGDCCDGRMMCDDHCDNLLTVCVSDRSFAQGDPPDGCVTGDESRVEDNNDDVTFDVGADALQGLPNPLVITVAGPWPSDPPRSLWDRAGDVDESQTGILVEAIGQININLSNINPGDSVGPMQYDRTWDSYPEGIHVNLSLTLRCSENYYGLDCNHVCVAADSELGHYACDENGTIVCNEGYRNTSTNCTECVPAEGCSTQGGYCDGPNVCLCLPFYTGSLCDIDLDPCDHAVPCENGATCTNTGDGNFNCTCSGGLKGERCQLSYTNECEPDPCQNGATCVDLFNDYTCQCLNGYEGKNCATNTDDCLANPCINGPCIDLLEDYMCTCPSGYSGKNCSEDSRSGSNSSSSPAALGGVVAGIAILVLIIVILITIVIVVLNRKIFSTKLNSNQDISIKANEAYGTSPASIPLADNAAYHPVQHSGPLDDEGYVINQLTYDLPHTSTPTAAIPTATNAAYGGVHAATADDGGGGYDYVIP